MPTSCSIVLSPPTAFLAECLAVGDGPSSKRGYHVFALGTRFRLHQTVGASINTKPAVKLKSLPLGSPRHDRQGSSVNIQNIDMKPVTVKGDRNVVEVKHSVQINESHECA
jgi:hypothetical protein